MIGKAASKLYLIFAKGYYCKIRPGLIKVAWPNGKASDYDSIRYQEIAGSTPAVASFLFCIFNVLLKVYFPF